MNYPYQPATPANDRTQLWGILALVFGAIPCCWLGGIVFAILQIVEARKWNKKPTLGYIALGLVAFWFVVWLLLTITGNINYRFNTTGT